MFNPCYEHCYAKYGKEYTKECNEKCEFAKTVLEKMKLEEKVKELEENALKEMKGIVNYNDYKCLR